MSLLRRCVLTATCLLAACSSDEPSPAPGPGKGTPPKGPPLFTDITAQCGITFTHQNGATGKRFYPETMGAGVALFDYDNDGDLDIYFVNGNHLDKPADPKITNVLYRNKGDGTFEDVTQAAGVGDPSYGQGCVTADYDNDGDYDLFVSNLGPDKLYRNEGDGTFKDVTEEAGIENVGLGQGCAFFDFDGDGLLDLYSQNYLTYTIDMENKRMRGDYNSPLVFKGAVDMLFRNKGDGTFEEVSAKVGFVRKGKGAANDKEWPGRGMGVACVDFDFDGDIDVYIANDAMVSYYFVNQGDGTFKDESTRSGLAYDAEGLTESTMGVDVGDLDGDGRIDLVSPVLRTQGCPVYFNQGRFFEEVSKATGIHSATLPYTGFSPNLFDVDNDGDIDFFLCNGDVERQKDAKPGESYDKEYGVRDQMFLNDGRGRFTEAPNPGAHFRRELVGRGSAVGDLDGDGDLDLVLGHLLDKPVILRNDAPKANWLRLKLTPQKWGKDAIGARITIEAGGKKQVAVVRGGGAYCSISDRRPHFGLGPVSTVDKVEVRWPSGKTTTLTQVQANQVVKVAEK